MTGASGEITVGITGGVGGALVVAWAQRYEVGAAYSSVDVTVKFTRTGSAYDGTFSISRRIPPHYERQHYSIHIPDKVEEIFIVTKRIILKLPYLLFFAALFTMALCN